MGAALGTGKSNRNVDLNIVPFIDLMSCLTAFLLVTAVWVDTAAIDLKPRGHARDEPKDCKQDPSCDDPKLSVLVQHDGIWIGVSRVNDFERIPNTAAGYDWDRLAERLAAQKRSVYFVETEMIEVAVESSREHPLTYQTMVSTMDVAVRAGFRDVGIADPLALSARPTI
jgi:biopolymer transport protein TolR